jgi:hypothetical protein
MDAQDEWGPWIEHDGRGCPCVGEIVQAKYNNGFVDNPSPAYGGKSWFKEHRKTHAQIILYRISKPRGIAVLKQLLADLPAPEKHKETTE